MTFIPPSSGGGGGLTSPFTADNVYNDNKYAVFGTCLDASLGFNTTGAGATSEALWLGLKNGTPAMYIGNEANKNYDPIGINASAFFSDPIQFIFSSVQT